MDISLGWLFSTLVTSAIGFGTFTYGRKQDEIVPLIAGLALMTVPGFISDPLLIMLFGGAVLAALWGTTRTG